MGFAIRIEDDLDIIDEDRRGAAEPINVDLPYRFTPRPYQRDLFTAKFDWRKQRFCIVWHRRAGKDKTYWQIAVAAAQENPGAYWYMLPKQTQARKVI